MIKNFIYRKWLNTSCSSLIQIQEEFPFSCYLDDFSKSKYEFVYGWAAHNKINAMHMIHAIMPMGIIDKDQLMFETEEDMMLFNLKFN